MRAKPRSTSGTERTFKMKNTHTIATLAVAAFASACVVGFQTPRQEPQPSQATIEGNEREAVREELRALSKIVLFYVGENDGKVPVFSSRMPPVWASTPCWAARAPRPRQQGYRVGRSQGVQAYLRVQSARRSRGQVARFDRRPRPIHRALWPAVVRSLQGRFDDGLPREEPVGATLLACGFADAGTRAPRGYGVCQRSQIVTSHGGDGYNASR